MSVLAARVADQTGLPVTHVEKDFWVTEVLRGVVAAAEDLGAHVLFKGGTSLSKVFNLIDRFSEDVDMRVLLELGSRGGALEAAPAAVSSLIAQHAADTLAGFAEAEPVPVRVMAPWRTLVEKLVLLHTAHLDEEPTKAVKGARHYYDVHQLLNRTEVLSGLVETGVGALARDVCLYSRSAGRAAADRPAGGSAASPAFGDGRHVQAARAEYERRVLGELLWPNAPRPAFDECLATVHHHAAQI